MGVTGALRWGACVPRWRRCVGLRVVRWAAGRVLDRRLCGGRTIMLICCSAVARQSGATHARVAELADALASGASDRKVVGVQVPPRAPRQTPGIATFPGVFSCRWRSSPAAGRGRARTLAEASERSRLVGGAQPTSHSGRTPGTCPHRTPLIVRCASLSPGATGRPVRARHTAASLSGTGSRVLRRRPALLEHDAMPGTVVRVERSRARDGRTGSSRSESHPERLTAVGARW